MKRKLTVALIFAVLLSVVSNNKSWSWGFFAHKRINRMAVFTLPPAMLGFYKKHIEFITEHAVDPDKRRYAVEGEAPHHYIDIDHYSKDNPFGVMPRYWKAAVDSFTEDTLEAYGVVPWHIQTMYWRLRDAFKEEDLDRVLRYSADIGHYIADAHVPLHTTENYNGHLTDQKGIHGFWESRLPELFAEDFNYFVGKAVYVENVLDAAWNAVQESHWAVDSVLMLEARLNGTFPSDKKYSYETRGTVTMKVHSHEYSMAYYEMLDNMVERRMRKAIRTVGSIWYTCWVDAGQPDLGKLDKKDVSEDLKKQMKTEDEMWRQGKIKGRKHQD